MFALKQNIPEEITNKIKQAKFWNLDQVVSDLVLLNKGSQTRREAIYLSDNIIYSLSSSEQGDAKMAKSTSK
ncbi:MAG: hypothetical protein MTP17_00410 [Candidatus Midichloria sp.]|nr:MAG: hypothetical protein MTP17_00410 [Candidatus Midichloria sp.]